MENIKNFVNGITGNDGQRKRLTNQTPHLAIPRVDGQSDRNLNSIKQFGPVEATRKRTESESSSASMSSMSPAPSQKDKDSYFWVM